MFRSTLIASLIALGTAGAAFAQDSGPRLVGGGGDGGPRIEYSQPSQNVVGGGSARIIGGGENQQVVYGPRNTSQASSGLVARLVGGGADRRVIYEAAPNASPALAGQMGSPRS
ncbi:hypothetical protein ACFQS7_28115 [Dankookia sp. GCM10030260]|uniref:hypothetical protein n=1 Tax=Dankookia sp. GCM10030260 TaxID=3273390 RepID=UPI003620B2AF